MTSHEHDDRDDLELDLDELEFDDVADKPAPEPEPDEPEALAAIATELEGAYQPSVHALVDDDEEEELLESDLEDTAYLPLLDEDLAPAADEPRKRGFLKRRERPDKPPKPAKPGRSKRAEKVDDSLWETRRFDG